MHRLRLGVNIDHVATLRNARGGDHPDPIRAARLVADAGGDGITLHLREDRRHVTDADLAAACAEAPLPINLEMAATPEMIALALQNRPTACCIVPERRAERTTENGLDAVGLGARLVDMVHALRHAGIKAALFLDPAAEQLDAAVAAAADAVELHTGAYAEAGGAERALELERLEAAAATLAARGVACHAGHGLTYDNVADIAAISAVEEVNIGHFLIGEALFSGFVPAVRRMREVLDRARTGA
ncbi:MAG: pyridoxine 5'-phosphate synthase [Alphaproteobacteria bacterium]|jgi:pyridoxine 5-phosphate synthase|nr:pyridoxine 5'-phosphate synthase [Alphaproteobacteria bacterium]